MIHSSTRFKNHLNKQANKVVSFFTAFISPSSRTFILGMGHQTRFDSRLAGPFVRINAIVEGTIVEL